MRWQGAATGRKCKLVAKHPDSNRDHRCAGIARILRTGNNHHLFNAILTVFADGMVVIIQKNFKVLIREKIGK